jgi:hypothetical protein
VGEVEGLQLLAVAPISQFTQFLPQQREQHIPSPW